jgi:hypothetical protein
MRSTIRSFFFLTPVVCGVVNSSLAEQGTLRDFTSIISAPARYHNEVVTLMGVVVGDGPEFELFRDASAAQRERNPSKSILLITQPRWKPKETYNMRMVRVTGRVDANQHGFWGNPCTIVVDAIKPISAPLASSKASSAIFRNETSKPLIVQLIKKNGGTFFPILPKGLIEVDGESSVVRVSSSAGSLMFEERIIANKNSPFYDSRNGDFYYRILNRKIERVLPSDAVTWREEALRSRAR